MGRRFREKPIMTRVSFVSGCRLLVIVAFLASAGFFGGNATVDAQEPLARAGEEGLFALPGELPDKQSTDPSFRYEIKLDQEKFYLFVPPNYRGNERFGLLVFIHAGDQMNVPADWKKTLTNRKLLFIAPQNVGNRQPVARRVSASLVAIHKMMELYDVDPERIYVAGHSGGAKVAGALASTEVDLVRGALLNCAVILPSDAVTDEAALKKVKSQVRFAMITGPKDFNHEAIVSIHDQLAEENYRVKLFDVPGMGHQLARAPAFAAAIAWLDEGDKPADEDKRAKPAASKKTPAKKK